MDAPPPPPPNNNNNNKPKPAMKLKLTTAASKQPPPTPPVQTPGGTKLKLKIGGSSSNTPVAEHAPAFPSAASASAQPPPKPKRKYTKKPKDSAAEGSAAAAAPKPTKKRKAEGDGETTASPKKPKPTTLKIKQEKGPQQPTLQRTPSLSIKLKNSAPKATPIPRIKVKHVGQPPPRPAGVGYDSEAEDIEEDPAIEHQMILRMLPGPDCDYLRKAIDDRRLGIPVKDGGADIQFRFFDREGRRACITIQGSHYAASLVDLPCVIEGMKSWEKKAGWFKSADICQMLLVLGKVDNEDAAKDYPLPREVEKDTWQYPHGLTPPMHYVRKRRFRKRVSYRTIEAVEEEVERLLELDEKAKESGGATAYEIVDLHRQRDGSSVAGDDAYEQGLINEQVMDEDGDLDEATMARLMEQELGGDDHEEHASEIVKSVEDAMSANDIDAAHAVVSHALGQETTPAVETPGGPSAAETEQSESESDEGDDEDVDEAALAAQQEAAQQREEIADLQREVENARLQMEKQSNPLLKNRLAAKFKSLQSDLELKKASLGDEWDDGLFATRERIRTLGQMVREAEEKALGQGNLLLKTRLRVQSDALKAELGEKEEEMRVQLGKQREGLVEELRRKKGMQVQVQMQMQMQKASGGGERRDSLVGGEA